MAKLKRVSGDMSRSHSHPLTRTRTHKWQSKNMKLPMSVVPFLGVWSAKGFNSVLCHSQQLCQWITGGFYQTNRWKVTKIFARMGVMGEVSGFGWRLRVTLHVILITTLRDLIGTLLSFCTRVANFVFAHSSGTRESLAVHSVSGMCQYTCSFVCTSDIICMFFYVFPAQWISQTQWSDSSTIYYM